MVFSEIDKPFKIVQLIVYCTALVFVVLGTYARTNGDPANSRLATVLSLTEDGTWYIDRPADREANRFEQTTVDKVMVNGHILSSKPPMMVLFMTGEYLLLKGAFGLDLNEPEDANQIIRVLSITLVGIPYVITLVFFVRILEMYRADPMGRVVLLLALAYCTQLWGYSLNINNHVPGACLTVLAIYFGLGLIDGKHPLSPWRFFVFGLCAGLVPTVDTPAAVFPFLAGLYLLKKHPRQTLTWAVLGAAIPLGVHAGVLAAVTGSPFPVQTREDLYLYRGAYWRHPIQVDALNEPKGNYLFHMTFGRTGLFLLYPVLLLGIASAVRAVFRRDVPLRRHILVGAVGFLVLSLYYLLKTNNYGGQAYGFRWYIPAMPVLLLMGAPLLARLRVRWQWIVVGLLIGVSFYSAWESTVTPWAANQEWTVRFLGPSYK